MKTNPALRYPMIENAWLTIFFQKHLMDIYEQNLPLWLENRGYPSFHAKQIFRWLYKKVVFSFDEMRDLGSDLRQALKKDFDFCLPLLEKEFLSKDGETIKFLWRLSDGYRIESVLILAKSRRTVCLSTQVGCGCRCHFCASGKKGLIRNLSTSEIIKQFLLIQKRLLRENKPITHVVFMGMGEPLANYDAVIFAIRLFSCLDGIALSQRRITLSTVGLIHNIDRLKEEDLNINLALSLHAADQKLREKIIPYAKKHPLEELFKAMDRYFQKTKRNISYEYLLIADINDSDKDADRLATLLKKRQGSINLIPYNPIPFSSYRRPTKERIERFEHILKKRKLQIMRRYTKGKDISAACGQLTLLDID